MIDQALERRLTDCRALLKLWGLFQQYFEAAVKGEGLVPDNEKKFLDLKSRIAMLHDTFLETVEEGGQSAIAQGMLDNVIRSITLRHLNRMPPADIRKMQIEWHESYLLLNETIGNLEEKQNEIAKITPSQWRSMQAKKAMARYFANLYNSNMLRGILIIGAILIVLVGLPMMGVFSYGALRDIGPLQKPVYWAIESIVRPYIVKVNWRTLAEAKEFGRSGEPTQKFPDYSSANFPNTPKTADETPAWLMQITGSQDQATFDWVAKATDKGMESYKVGDAGRKLLVYYYIMPSAKEADDAVNKFRTWTAALPPQAQTISEKLQIADDWNLVILVIGDSPDDRNAMLNTIWQVDQIKK